MANLKNRDAKVTSNKTVVKNSVTESVLKYRGVSYKPSEIKKAVPIRKSGTYRGSTWEA